MKIFGVLLVIGVACGVLFYFKLLPRAVYTVWLIAQTRPYTQQPENPTGSILVAGDSTGYGTGVQDAKDSIAGRVGADFPNHTIENISVNGAMITDMHVKLREIDATYDLVVLQIGANDILMKRSATDIEADFRVLITEAQRISSNVILMTAGNIGAAPAFVRGGEPDAELMQLSRDVREVSLRLADETGIQYVDLFAEPEDDPFISEPAVYAAIDQLHPTAVGYGLWYQELKQVLDRVRN